MSAASERRRSGEAPLRNGAAYGGAAYFALERLCLEYGHARSCEVGGSGMVAAYMIVEAHDEGFYAVALFECGKKFCAG